MLKSISLSMGLAFVGSIANAATFASIDVDGTFNLLPQPALELDGNFDARFGVDDTFDFTQPTDFLLEADLSLGGLSVLDEELLIEDFTGEDLAFGLAELLAFFDDLLPGAVSGVINEALDSNGEQSNIFDTVFLSLDIDVGETTASSAEGSFTALLSDGFFSNSLHNNFSLGSGTFEGSLSITAISAVPLPATLPMLAFAGIGAIAIGRRRPL